MKIKLADGGQVTWQHDSLAGRSIEFLDALSAEDQSLAASDASGQDTPTTPPQVEPETRPATGEPPALDEQLQGSPLAQSNLPVRDAPQTFARDVARVF